MGLTLYGIGAYSLLYEHLPNPLIRIERAMDNKQIAELLKDSVQNGDIDSIWFGIGELERDYSADTIKQPSCADRIKESLDSLNEDITALMDNDESDDNDDPALSVDTFKFISVCLSYGGPSSYLEIKATEDNEIISVTYRFSDWFDTATLPVFESDPAYTYARYIMEGQE